MKKYKKHMILVLASLFVICLSVNGFASEWEIVSPWNKVGPNTTLAVPTDNVGIGTGTPAFKLDVAGASSIGPLTFTGTGRRDVTLSGTYTGKDTQTLRIQIDGVGIPNTFRWSVDGGATWAHTGIPITGAAQPLNFIGVLVTFGATTGYTLGDFWQATLSPPAGIVNTTGGFRIGNDIFATSFGDGNTAIGIGAAGAGRNTGRFNTFIGWNAGRDNTTGIYNIFVGRDAGRRNTTGLFNTFVGTGAGSHNTTGFFNTFVGVSTGHHNTTGVHNTFLGGNAGISSTTGHFNTFVGADTGLRNTTGANNTFIGADAGHTNTIGSSNVFIGKDAGRHLVDGVTANTASNNSVFIGNNTRASAADNINEIVIGTNAVGGGSNSMTLGNTDITRTVLRGSIMGGTQILSLPTPGIPTVTPHGTVGTTTWGYRITARSSVGETLASVEGRTTTGNAILSAANFNRITWTAVIGAIDYRIYRTTAAGTPATTGLIGTTTTLAFNDTGLAATTPVPTVDTSGNVGIGTTTPNSVMQIIGTTAGEGPTFGGAGSVLHVRQNTPWTARQPWALFVEGYSYLGGLRVFGGDRAGGGGERALYQTTPGNQLGLATTGDDPITFAQSSDIERMRIASGGNVGIGTTVPATRLHVAGTTRGAGGVQILNLPTPGAPTVTPQGTAGTTTWGYRITARSSVGETLASVEGRTTTGNAILSAANFNRITWTAVDGAVDYRIYRTTAAGTPATTGLIGTTTTLAFNDTGLAATTPVPTVDTSGSVGIGTTTPAAGNRLEVHDGHIVNTMTTPPRVTCNIGTPSIIGTDMSGAITTPVGATSCTITFTIPWNQIYACVVSASTSTAAPFVSALSNTSATFTYVTTGTPILYYHCSGR